MDTLKNTNCIVIILHGYTCSPKLYQPAKRIIEKEYPNAKVLIPKLPLQSLSVADPNKIISDLLVLIDKEWESMNTDLKEETKIIIIGHSTGALLARKLYVCACGENSDAPFEEIIYAASPRAWINSVERLILFAGMNRGWTVNHHLYKKTAFLIRMGITLGNILVFFGFKPLAFQTRRGASFITQLRIQWLSMLRNNQSKNIENAMVIQLLGTVDDIISPDDNIDLYTGSNFIYLEVPLSGHLDVLNMNDPVAGKQRADVFIKAITKSQEELNALQTITIDEELLKIDNSVTDVVFVVHGIRDTGYWTQKIARRVKSLGDSATRKFATETSTYGYFPMLPFLLSSVRRKKVEWFMDQYTENLAKYPSAKFSFLGHSNGTYMMAKALKEYPACKFKNVVFAGSVVHQKFDWSKEIQTRKIERFYNIVAASDWVVAMFPKSFQALSIQDLGSGGFDGFSYINKSHEFKYIKGDHSAALEEKYWNEIAHFIIHGEIRKADPTLQKHNRSRFMKILGATAPIPFLIIILFFISLAGVFWYFSKWAVNIKILIEILYIGLLWKGVTKL